MALLGVSLTSLCTFTIRQFKPRMISAIEAARPQPLHTFLSLWPSVRPEVMRLVKRMMNWNLGKIPTAMELLKDPLFDELYHMMGPGILRQVWSSPIPSFPYTEAVKKQYVNIEKLDR